MSPPSEAHTRILRTNNNQNQKRKRNIMKNTIKTTTENGDPRIIDMNAGPHNQNVSVWDSTGAAAESIWTYETGVEFLRDHPEDLVLTDEQIETLNRFEPLAIK